MHQKKNNNKSDRRSKNKCILKRKKPYSLEKEKDNVN